MNITKNIIQSLRKPLVGCLTALSLLIAPVIMPGCTSDSESEQAADDFRGEELFAGIFFNAGPAGGMVEALSPEAGQDFISSLTEDEWAQLTETAGARFREAGLDKFADTLEATSLEEVQAESEPGLGQGDQFANLFIDMIAAEDPGFFDRFAEDIQSGDHYRVAEAMREAGEYTFAALTALGQSSPEADESAGLCIFIFAFLAVVGTQAAVINLVAAINLTAAVNAAQAVISVGPQSGSLQGEALVHEITTTFAR